MEEFPSGYINYSTGDECQMGNGQCPGSLELHTSLAAHVGDNHTVGLVSVKERMSSRE